MPRVIIVTGSRKGIGKSLSEYYLNKGDIVCGCSRNQSDLKHENYRHFILDVCDEESVVSMVKAVKKEFGSIDVLLNNAGIASMNHILTTPLQTMQNIFNTNVFGSFLFLREVAKVMVQGYKKLPKDPTIQMPYRIVNFATVATPLKLEGEAAYAASKAALVNLTQVCAKELGEFGITVNAVGPTPVLTDLIKNVPKIKIDSLLKQQAIKRFGEFEDVINVVEFFLDKRSDFITAQTIYLGGVNG